MSLREQQDLIAHLYCDAGFRAAFFAAPLDHASETGLSNDLIQQIATAIPDEIEYFAKTLVWKRQRAVEKMLPMTRAALGADFAREFENFATRFQPESLKKHLEDALAFAAAIENSSADAEIRATARYERTRLRFFSEQRRFSICRVTEGVRGRVAGIAEPTGRGRSRIAVWIRTGRRVRHFFV